MSVQLLPTVACRGVLTGGDTGAGEGANGVKLYEAPVSCISGGHEVSFCASGVTASAPPPLPPQPCRCAVPSSEHAVGEDTPYKSADRRTVCMRAAWKTPLVSRSGKNGGDWLAVRWQPAPCPADDRSSYRLPAPHFVPLTCS